MRNLFISSIEQVGTAAKKKKIVKIKINLPDLGQSTILFSFLFFANVRVLIVLQKFDR
jgi:hypothetical protein